MFQDRLRETRHEWIYILIGNPPTLLYPCCASNVAMDFSFRPVASCVGILTLIFTLRGVSVLAYRTKTISQSLRHILSLTVRQCLTPPGSLFGGKTVSALFFQNLFLTA